MNLVKGLEAANQEWIAQGTNFLQKRRNSVENTEIERNNSIENLIKGCNQEQDIIPSGLEARRESSLNHVHNVFQRSQSS
jgi:hypothetical protein